MQLVRCVAVALVLASPGRASAQPTPAPAPAPEPAKPDEKPAGQPAEKPDEKPASADTPAQDHTAASVAKAPEPGQVTGVSRAEPESYRMRSVGRVLLYPVRGLLWVVDAPFRGGAWLYERYRLRDRWKSIFFNDTGTIGLYPAALVETGFGLNIGARFVHRDLFGASESLKMRASFGGRFRQLYSIKLSTGDRLGAAAALELEGEYEVRPRDRFYGIGNGDEVDSVAMPIDPYADPTAVATRFRQKLARVAAIADLLLAGPLSARVSGALLSKRFDGAEAEDIPSKEDDLPDAYDTGSLPAFDDGTDYLYNELELRLDTRDRASRYEPQTQPSQGLLLSGFTGVATGLAGAETDYVRYGADLQLYLRLGASPRVLILRGLVEEVRGTVDQIPFVDLPRLGGPLLLRGYDQDRFRDLAFALTSAEYIFDLTNLVSAYGFVDAGRVYPSLADIEADDLRVGFGGGLQLQTDHSYLGRASLASSIDGGLLFHLSFDPIYDPKARVERK